jgi:hypothetical protein
MMQPLAPSPRDATAAANSATASVAEATTPAKASAGALIVNDDAREVGPGQMRKGEFLDQMEKEVCAAADAELAAAGRTAQGCPYIRTWLGFYRNRPGEHVERALRKYAPEAAGASTARDYIPIVSRRVRRAAAVWVTTGQITGLPEELAGQLPGAGLLRAVGGFLAGAASAVAGVFGGIGRAIGGLFTKSRGDGERQVEEPEQIRAQLGSGDSLDASVRTKMESAFGHDFSRVRVHTGNNAVELSQRLNARAFTIGSDVAFDAGEYQPGTLTGDVLLAHELAHVVQQGPALSSSLEKGGSEALEEDADTAAVGAVGSIWGGEKGLSNLPGATAPQLKSRLGLQRCARSPKFSKTACKNPVKTVTVDFVRLRGSSRTPATDLEFANKVFAACCVQFAVGKNEPAKKSDSDAWLYGDTVLNREKGCGAPSSEELDMFTDASTTHGLSAKYRVFYVESVDPPARAYSAGPYCATGARATLLNMIVVTNQAKDRSLAHEFGHVLINTGSHTGIDKPGDTDNIMEPTDSATGEVVDATQCSRAYGNA